MKEETTVVNSGIWVQIVKDEKTGEVFIQQGPRTTLVEVLGLLESAKVTYETKHKLEMEYQHLDAINNLVNNLSENVSKMAQSAKTIEGVMVRTAAASQNIMRTVNK